MDQIQREKVLEKLGKIKALAERGVGGEKETAMRMYEDLCRKYDISEDEAEAAEIELLFGFYREEMKRELEVFMIAFKQKNNLFPDEKARAYKEYDGPEREMTEEEKRKYKKAAFMRMMMDGRTPPKAAIEAREVKANG